MVRTPGTLPPSLHTLLQKKKCASATKARRLRHRARATSTALSHVHMSSFSSDYHSIDGSCDVAPRRARQQLCSAAAAAPRSLFHPRGVALLAALALSGAIFWLGTRGQLNAHHLSLLPPPAVAPRTDQPPPPNAGSQKGAPQIRGLNDSKVVYIIRHAEKPPVYCPEVAPGKQRLTHRIAAPDALHPPRARFSTCVRRPTRA